MKWKTWGIAVVLLCQLLVWSPLFAKSNAQLYAVVVGVSKFQDPNVPELKLSSQDALDFAEFLKEQGQEFGKPPVITTLVNERATRANVAEALRTRLKAAKKDDIVIIYMSGHGTVEDELGKEFYFITHDARVSNLFGTGLLMNDPRLFKGIKCENVVMLTDACYSAGFVDGFQKPRAKSLRLKPKAASRLFQSLKGRKAIASSRPDEESFEHPKFRNSLFTHFLLKGIRGDADSESRDGKISVAELFKYIEKKTTEITDGRQNPQIFPASARSDQSTVFVVPTFKSPLKIRIQFEYVDDKGEVKVLTDGSVLHSGQKIGVSFQPKSDCYVYIFWWDSSGNVGRLFPNAQLTEGKSHVIGGQNYWLPRMRDETSHHRWYVLDEKVGEETIYFIASRKRNPRLEGLYANLSRMSKEARNGTSGKHLARKLEREINRMGFAKRTETRGPEAKQTSFVDRESLFKAMRNEVSVAGADIVYRVRFEHRSRPQQRADRRE